MDFFFVTVEEVRFDVVLVTFEVDGAFFVLVAVDNQCGFLLVGLTAFVVF